MRIFFGKPVEGLPRILRHLPGDKSIAHRALMLAAIANGKSKISNIPNNKDLLTTISLLRTLGVKINQTENYSTIEGCEVWPNQKATLDCGSSGTTLRLILGLLAGRSGDFHITANAQLAARPILPVIELLREMGARIELKQHLAGSNSTLDIHLIGAKLRGINHFSNSGSAQLKSAVLLAALHAETPTKFRESMLTRDHTERMLAALGICAFPPGQEISIRSAHIPAFEIAIPGDISSAAVWMASQAMRGDGNLQIHNVSLNSSRLGMVKALRRMGVVVDCRINGQALGEPWGKVSVSGRACMPLFLESRIVPQLIDELPLLAGVAATQRAVSQLNGVSNLRVKESNRVNSLLQISALYDRNITEIVEGVLCAGGGAGQICNPSNAMRTIPKTGDHRMIMLAVAYSLAHPNPHWLSIQDHSAISKSYPNFWSDLVQLYPSVKFSDIDCPQNQH